MSFKKVWNKFWAWYNRHYVLNTGIAAGLFVVQLFHLYWLGADVIAERLTGESYFILQGIWLKIIILVDYTEIPALISTSLVYINELRRHKSAKAFAYLLFINTQYLHIFWITDEFVVASFTGEAHGTLLPVWLAWVAILIDYLELPVIYETIKKFFLSLKGDVELKEVFEED